MSIFGLQNTTTMMHYQAEGAFEGIALVQDGEVVDFFVWSLN